jgi:hypothetical protein
MQDNTQHIDAVDVSTLDVETLDVLDAVDAVALDDIDQTDDIADLIRSSGRAVAPVDDGTIGGPAPMRSHWSNGPGRWADRYVDQSTKIPASIWSKMSNVERRKIERERRADVGRPEPDRTTFVRRCLTCSICQQIDAVDRGDAVPTPSLRRSMRRSRSTLQYVAPFGSTVSTSTPSTVRDDYVDLCEEPTTVVVDLDAPPDAVRGLPGRGDLGGPVVRVNATPTVYVDDRGRRASARTFAGRRTGRTHPVAVYAVDVEHVDPFDIDQIDAVPVSELVALSAMRGTTGAPLDDAVAVDLVGRARSTRITIDVRREHVARGIEHYSTRLDRLPASMHVERTSTTSVGLDLDRLGIDAVDLVAAVVAGPGRSTSVVGSIVSTWAEHLDAVERLRTGDALDVAGTLPDAVRRSTTPDRTVGPNHVPVSRAPGRRVRFQRGRYSSGELVYGVEIVDGEPTTVVVGRYVDVVDDIDQIGDAGSYVEPTPTTVSGTRFVLTRRGWFVPA